MTERRFLEASGAPQQCAAAGLALVEMMAVYVIARALDRVLALGAEGVEETRRGG